MFAGDSVQTATGSVLIGHDAGASLTTQGRNVFIGENAGDAATVSSSILIGSDAGGGSLTGHGNVFIGERAGFVATSATKNVFVGNKAGDAATTTTGSILIGDNSGDALTTGGGNTFVGESTGGTITTGYRNIFVGWRAGNPQNGDSNAPAAGGFNNIIIGNNVGAPNAANNNQVVLGNIASDNYYYSANVNNWQQISDARDKVETGSLTLGLELIRQIQPKIYRWNKRTHYLNETEASESRVYASPLHTWGIIAQDIISLTGSYPSLSASIQSTVGTFGDGTSYDINTVSELGFLWPTVQAVKDLDGITAKTGSNSFTGTQTISGSLRISGSTSTGLFVNGITTTTDNLNRLTYNTTSGRVHYEVNKYKALFGDASNSSYAITHSLNSADIQVNIRDNSSGQIYYPSISAGTPPQYTATVTDANTVTISFTSAPSVNQYTIVVSK
jgi:hypothetical protein